MEGQFEETLSRHYETVRQRTITLFGSNVTSSIQAQKKITPAPARCEDRFCYQDHSIVRQYAPHFPQAIFDQTVIHVVPNTREQNDIETSTLEGKRPRIQGHKSPGRIQARGLFNVLGIDVYAGVDILFHVHHLPGASPRGTADVQNSLSGCVQVFSELPSDRGIIVAELLLKIKNQRKRQNFFDWFSEGNSPRSVCL